MQRALVPRAEFTSASPAISGMTIIRLGVAGAFTAVLMFVGCWIAAQLPYGPTAILVNVFTYAPAATTQALFGGVLIAAVMGFAVAALFGLAFAAFSFIERL